MITKEDFDHLDELANHLRTMKVVTGLCRTEKETLEEAANFISNAAEYLEHEISEDIKERVYQDFTWK